MKRSRDGAGAKTGITAKAVTPAGTKSTEVPGVSASARPKTGLFDRLAKFGRAHFKSALLAAALCVITVLLWCHVRDRFSWSKWGVPTGYNGDEILAPALVKAGGENDYIPIGMMTMRRMGAPYGGNWNDFPLFEKTLFWVLGGLSHFMGTIQALNFGAMMGHVTSALAFFAVARFLKYRREWAFAGALLFGFCYYQIFRNEGHLTIAYTFTIPFGILSTWLVMFSHRLKWGSAGCWICLVFGLILGLNNPYFLCMYVQLMVWAVVFQWLLARRKENLQIGIAALGMAAVGFFASNANYFIYQHEYGKNPDAILRHFFEVELYALKPMELVIPPLQHHLVLFQHIAEKYNTELMIRGEVFAPYQGLVGIAGFIWLVCAAVAFVIGKSKRHFPVQALQVLWVLAFCTTGGLNALLGLAGVQLFRGSNRFSMYIFTIVLLFFISRMSMISRRWSRQTSIIVSLVILAIGLYDQIPRAIDPADTAKYTQAIQNDSDFGAAMEARLPKGAMLFELPVMVFPEALPAGTITSYEHLKPFVFSKYLRVSFGSDRGRTRDEWQSDVEKMTADQMIQQLDKYGFAAIYINRKGYSDHGDKLIGLLLAALPDGGKGRLMEDAAHEQICIVIDPVSNPELPNTDQRAQIYYPQGWSLAEQTGSTVRHWTGGNAELKFFNPEKYPTEYDFRCLIGTITPRRVSIAMGSETLWKADLEANQGGTVNVKIMAKPGNNIISFYTDAPSYQLPERHLDLAIAVSEPQIVKSSVSGILK